VKVYGDNFMSWLTKGYYLRKKGVVKATLTLKTVLLRIVVILVILVVVLLAALMLGKNKLIFAPTKGLELSLKNVGWEFEDVWLTGIKGDKVNAWYLPGPPGAAVALLFHGNAGNLELMIGRAILDHKLGFGIMAVDYEGFGLSEGSPSEEAVYFDAQASWDFLIAKGIDPKRILIHGFSLGGAAASWLAYQQREHKNPLVLDSTFTDLKDVAEEKVPFLKPVLPLVLGKAFNTYERLKSINSSQLLVLHSPNDEIVPYELGKKIFQDYNGGPKEFVILDGGHLDFPATANLYGEAIYRLYGTWAKGEPEQVESDSGL
jgi:fermentation-respiration switch protein FrsA (DUF1100 family)